MICCGCSWFYHFFSTSNLVHWWDLDGFSLHVLIWFGLKKWCAPKSDVDFWCLPTSLLWVAFQSKTRAECRTSIFGWLNDVKRWNQPFPHEFWLKPTLVAIKPRTTPDIQGIRVAVFGVHRRNWSLLRCARGGPRNYRTLWGAAVQARAARCRLWCGCPTKIRAL